MRVNTGLRIRVFLFAGMVGAAATAMSCTEAKKQEFKDAGNEMVGFGDKGVAKTKAAGSEVSGGAQNKVDEIKSDSKTTENPVQPGVQKFKDLPEDVKHDVK